MLRQKIAFLNVSLTSIYKFLDPYTVFCLDLYKSMNIIYLFG